MTYIAASIMCGNQLNIGQELIKLEEAGCDMLHCDVMDGIYVNNLALGPEWINDVKNATTIPIDIHLATINPMKYIQMFAPIKPKYISFHIEVSEDVMGNIKKIRHYGIKPSIALNPETKIEEVIPYLSEIDRILMMTVNPGFSGQSFNSSVLRKLETLSDILSNRKHKPLIEVDGNINVETIGKMKKNLPDIFVLGTSALFHQKDEMSYAQRIERIRKQIQDYKQNDILE
ncbi:ribulose-phosphate 3-epimerase [Irregularibacter muris]|uniref:ribulose-phosphate 3-epimerase n=1 Tax=Irregularibacter muris TaxID=1796619 RepID=A0AAE3HD85_9FIRM|nr:ribulose-phosphate 3-epimerase [Irregularibacter muris]MCR1898272.1 ribulose-phosphate 3-epimerase [Irregularibacter muris]